MADQALLERMEYPGEAPGDVDACAHIGKRLRASLKSGVCILMLYILGAGVVGPCCAASSSTADGFRVQHVYGGSVYLDAGSNSGLREGQRLTVGRPGTGNDSGEVTTVGWIEIESVAAISAAGRILFSDSGIVPGDIAYSSPENPPAALKQSDGKTSSPDQVRAQNPVAGRKSVSSRGRGENRIRGRFGIDYSTLRIPDSEADSSQFGFMLRIDASRIAGSHWNMRGYYRGRLQSRRSSLSQETLTDLINRTYHLNITYENPDSDWVFGGGRLYIPWAASLDTLDGFYLGRKFGRQTAGIFLGTTPDPTSWNYNKDRLMGGAFYNVAGGSFESVRFDSTSGIAVSRVNLEPDRQFGFFENNISFKRYLSVYSNVEADLLTGAQNADKSEVVLSRSYFTVRFEPHKRISFTVNQNYFRNIPTFDTRLIGTGLVDEFLFQGLSGGFRLKLPYDLGIYGNVGRSSRTGDRKASWNYLGGISASDILNSGIRLGYRFSSFDSSFGRGTYQTFSASRDLGNYLQFELQGGQQNFKSVYTSQDRARFVHGNVDYFLGRKFFLGGGLTVYRGQVQDYNQVFVRFGYRFDNRR